MLLCWRRDGDIYFFMTYLKIKSWLSYRSPVADLFCSEKFDLVQNKPKNPPQKGPAVNPCLDLITWIILVQLMQRRKAMSLLITPTTNVKIGQWAVGLGQRKCNVYKHEVSWTRWSVMDGLGWFREFSILQFTCLMSCIFLDLWLQGRQDECVCADTLGCFNLSCYTRCSIFIILPGLRSTLSHVCVVL